MPEVTSLTIACEKTVFERDKAVFDGGLQIARCSIHHAPLIRGEMLFRVFEEPSFDVAEMSLSNFLSRKSRGDDTFTALPVYAARSFCHAGIYIRTDRNITSPEALKGRRIGISEFQHTAYVWTRGILQDEYGVRPSDISWISLGTDKHGDAGSAAFKPPAGVSIERRHRPMEVLSDMLESGEVDALITTRTPKCFSKGAQNIARLFQDYEAVEDDFYKRTHIFPILHVMGIKTKLVDEMPTLPGAVFDAFSKAENIYVQANVGRLTGADENDRIAPGIARLMRVIGNDYHGYGLAERETKALNLFMRYHFEQGLSDRRFTIPELFSPGSLSQYEAQTPAKADLS